jgi:hypothetical protein
MPVYESVTDLVRPAACQGRLSDSTLPGQDDESGFTILPNSVEHCQFGISPDEAARGRYQLARYFGRLLRRIVEMYPARNQPSLNHWADHGPAYHIRGPGPLILGFRMIHGNPLRPATHDEAPATRGHRNQRRSAIRAGKPNVREKLRRDTISDIDAFTCLSERFRAKEDLRKLKIIFLLKALANGDDLG